MSDKADKENKKDFIKAARKGDIAEIRRFLASGMSPDAMNIQRTSALVAATAGGNAEAIQILLDAGADVYAGAPNGTALVCAVYRYYSSVDIVKILLDAEMRGDGEKSGDVALMVAAQWGRMEIAEILLENEFIPADRFFPADYPEYDDEDVSINTAASYDGHVYVAFALLQKNPIPKRAYRYIAKVVFNLVDNGFSYNKEIWEEFLDKGLSPNMVRHYGETLLMAAAQCGNVSLVEVLLRHGAHPDAVDSDGKTALDKIQNYLQIAETLKRATRK